MPQFVTRGGCCYFWLTSPLSRCHLSWLNGKPSTLFQDSTKQPKSFPPKINCLRKLWGHALFLIGCVCSHKVNSCHSWKHDILCGLCAFTVLNFNLNFYHFNFTCNFFLAVHFLHHEASWMACWRNKLNRKYSSWRTRFLQHCCHPRSGGSKKV